MENQNNQNNNQPEATGADIVSFLLTLVSGIICLYAAFSIL